MEQCYINGRELKDFVEQHDLQNRYSVTHFQALLTIRTAENKMINRQVEILISFDNFNSLGQVTIMDSTIDPMLFPTVFEANYQKMEHINEEYLLITDVHTKNAQIGDYEVKIIPLGRTQD